jgi:hypothetical protein
MPSHINPSMANPDDGDDEPDREENDDENPTVGGVARGRAGR